jgi:hypothetical protein
MGSAVTDNAICAIVARQSKVVFIIKILVIFLYELIQSFSREKKRILFLSFFFGIINKIERKKERKNKWKRERQLYNKENRSQGPDFISFGALNLCL